jgi:pseudouridine-5'-phosphate glycosidase
MSIEIAPRVAQALSARRSVVALESALITHGLPHPLNREVAEELERTVRQAGAEPATIGVVEGRVKAGLEPQELEHLATAQAAHKISLRDLPLAVARRWDGGTTVAATAWVAWQAGIRVFATGGIGGVHRGAAMDVSADLPVLARTPIVVVCAGAKAILDLPRTREWLETFAVPVLGYGTDEFPAFYRRRSGLPVDARVESPHEVAAMVRAAHALGLRSATLVTVPIPEEAEPPEGVMEEAIQRAQAEAMAKGISGAELTPFLLARLHELTDGAATRANLALLMNNARVAAAIAVALAPSDH